MTTGTGTYLEITEQNIREIQSEGLVIFTVPTFSDIVTIDIDLDEGDKFQEIDPQILDSLHVEDMFETRSKSGNKHVFLRLSSPQSRPWLSLIAAASGSDLKRELLSTKRLEDPAVKYVWCIVETKVEAIRLREWLKNSNGHSGLRDDGTIGSYPEWRGNGLTEIPELPPLPDAQRPGPIVTEDEDPF